MNFSHCSFIEEKKWVFFSKNFAPGKIELLGGNELICWNSKFCIQFFNNLKESSQCFSSN